MSGHADTKPNRWDRETCTDRIFVPSSTANSTLSTQLSCTAKTFCRWSFNRVFGKVLPLKDTLKKPYGFSLIK